MNATLTLFYQIDNEINFKHWCHCRFTQLANRFFSYPITIKNSEINPYLYTIFASKNDQETLVKKLESWFLPEFQRVQDNKLAPGTLATSLHAIKSFLKFVECQKPVTIRDSGIDKSDLSDAVQAIEQWQGGLGKSKTDGLHQVKDNNWVCIICLSAKYIYKRYWFGQKYIIVIVVDICTLVSVPL